MGLATNHLRPVGVTDHGPGGRATVGRGVAALALTVVVTAATMVGLDLLWLGVLGQDFYREALGGLRRESVYLPAAAGFYAFYVAFIIGAAVVPARRRHAAALRGAALGLLAYGTYHLTNWAVIAGWPASLIVIDTAWGVALTGSVAAVGHWAFVGAAAEGMAGVAGRPVIEPLPGESRPMLWGRRLLSVGFVALACGVAWAALPLWLVALLARDVAQGAPRRFGRTRSGLFLLFYLTCEVWGLLLATGVWVVSLGGMITSPQRYRDYNATIQRWWSTVLFRGALRLFSMRLCVDGTACVWPAPFLLLVRHASAADTVLAANLVANPNGILLRYVLKRQLLWDPCLDVVGRRLPNAFIDRTGAGRTRAVDEMARLADGLDARSALLIYPEGTRFSPRKLAAAREKLRAGGRQELAALADGMRFVLPPRLGGVCRVMQDHPQWDIVVLAHTGFDDAPSFKSFFSGGLVGKTVHAKLWRLCSADHPRPEDRERWLFERWLEVDAWVTAHRNTDGAAGTGS